MISHEIMHFLIFIKRNTRIIEYLFVRIKSTVGRDLSRLQFCKFSIMFITKAIQCFLASSFNAAHHVIQVKI